MLHPLPSNILQVLEEEEYLRRKEYYNSTGQRHYYFMNVGNGEVIDACRKVRVAPALQECEHGYLSVSMGLEQIGFECGG